MISLYPHRTVLAAIAAHEVNRTFCESLGDFTQVPFKEAPDEIKESVIAGVKAIENNPELTPEDSHANWLHFKEERGWKHGPKKDFEKREHPCMVPYHELPPEQRAKDTIYGAVVRAVLAALGDERFK